MRIRGTTTIRIWCADSLLHGHETIQFGTVSSATETDLVIFGQCNPGENEPTTATAMFLQLASSQIRHVQIDAKIIRDQRFYIGNFDITVTITLEICLEQYVCIVISASSITELTISANKPLIKLMSKTVGPFRSYLQRPISSLCNGMAPIIPSQQTKRRCHF